jgi:hypothetical protein
MGKLKGRIKWKRAEFLSPSWPARPAWPSCRAPQATPPWPSIPAPPFGPRRARSRGPVAAVGSARSPAPAGPLRFQRVQCARVVRSPPSLPTGARVPEPRPRHVFFSNRPSSLHPCRKSRPRRFLRPLTPSPPRPTRATAERTGADGRASPHRTGPAAACPARPRHFPPAAGSQRAASTPSSVKLLLAPLLRSCLTLRIRPSPWPRIACLAPSSPAGLAGAVSPEPAAAVSAGKLHHTLPIDLSCVPSRLVLHARAPSFLLRVLCALAKLRPLRRTPAGERCRSRSGETFLPGRRACVDGCVPSTSLPMP